MVAFSITIYSTINTPQKEMLQLQKEDDKFIPAKFRIKILSSCIVLRIYVQEKSRGGGSLLYYIPDAIFSNFCRK